ncbi:uncharacterized protein LOC126844282 [Adelges cooleyi]|uniref:uncharacterized protein LOC126844282 n=1 Tax=Adelges cooleyi TaxID=133065 RepID=UPI0021803983|nr:uncharacterized protein LOC126844282 [Adelges cooleyi]
MRSTTILLALAAYFIFSLADTDVNYYVDESTLPEALPEQMRNQYSDKEIELAIRDALENQYKVVSEYNGHVYDPASPFGYFRDDVNVSITRASSSDFDMIFETNTVKGLSNYQNSTIVIRWAKDQVYQEVYWNELQIKGQYKYLDRSRYEIGKYQLFVNGVKYQFNSPLSANTEMYPISAPKSAIHYDEVRASFDGGYREVFNSKHFPYLLYFLEDVAFQKIANQVLQDMQNNVTTAIRAAVKPYINFKNYSDPHFPKANGQLKNGPSFKISNVFTTGLNNTLQKLQSLQVNMNSNSVTAQTSVYVHNLTGTFDLAVEGPQKYRSQAKFSFEYMELIIKYDIVRPHYNCKTIVKMYQPKVYSAYQKQNARECICANQQFADAFALQINDHISKGFCKFIINYTKNVGTVNSNNICNDTLSKDRL